MDEKKRPARIDRVKQRGRFVVMQRKSLAHNFGENYCAHAKAGALMYTLHRVQPGDGYVIAQEVPLRGLWIGRAKARLPACTKLVALDAFRDFLEKNRVTYNKIVTDSETV